MEYFLPHLGPIRPLVFPHLFAPFSSQLGTDFPSAVYLSLEPLSFRPSDLSSVFRYSCQHPPCDRFFMFIISSITFLLYACLLYRGSVFNVTPGRLGAHLQSPSFLGLEISRLCAATRSFPAWLLPGLLRLLLQPLFPLGTSVFL